MLVPPPFFSFLDVLVLRFLSVLDRPEVFRTRCVRFLFYVLIRAYVSFVHSSVLGAHPLQTFA